MAAAVGNEMPAPRQCAAIAAAVPTCEFERRRQSAALQGALPATAVRGTVQCGDGGGAVAESAVSDRPRRLHNVSTTHSELYRRE